MKISKLISFIAILTCFLLSGCEEIVNEYIVDWAPVNIYIYATDKEGNSIIEPDMPGMTLTYKDRTYSVNDWNNRYDTPTKAYLAQLYGLFAQEVEVRDSVTTYRLIFGEIDGAADMDEDIILNWPDGSVDTIHYHCSDHKGGKNFKCNRSWKLNGKKHEGNEFTFTGKGK